MTPSPPPAPQPPLLVATGCALRPIGGDGGVSTSAANLADAANDRSGWGEQQPKSGEGSRDVADAEKQFARGLPIGTSSEYPRLGVSGENVADANGAQREGDQRAKRIGAEHADISRAGWWITEPDVGRETDGLAEKLDIPSSHD